MIIFFVIFHFFVFGIYYFLMEEGKEELPQCNYVNNRIAEDLDKHGYDTVELIGNGGFGQCYLVNSRRYNMPFACKVMPMMSLKSDLRQVFENEVDALIHVIHHNIIQVYEYFSTESYMYMILEYCPNGDLSKYVRKHGPFQNDQELLRTLSMMLSALKYLESENITHNDIKPENFLIDNYGRIKLTDFGLTKTKFHHGQLTNDFRGSLIYCAPEIIENKAYDPYKSQIWSFGVTVFFLATGSIPFKGTSIHEIKTAIATGSFKLPIHLPSVVKQVILRCLRIEPQTRTSFAELKQLIDAHICGLSNSNITILNSPIILKKRIVRPGYIIKKLYGPSKSFVK